MILRDDVLDYLACYALAVAASLVSRRSRSTPARPAGWSTIVWSSLHAGFLAVSGALFAVQYVTPTRPALYGLALAIGLAGKEGYMGIRAMSLKAMRTLLEASNGRDHGDREGGP